MTTPRAIGVRATEGGLNMGPPQGTNSAEGKTWIASA